MQAGTRSCPARDAMTSHVDIHSGVYDISGAGVSLAEAPGARSHRHPHSAQALLNMNTCRETSSASKNS